MGTLLIVDDEKNVISSFKKILSQDGYTVLSANNVLGGLALAKENTLDLLIMDIRMPGMSGLEAVSEFKEINPKLPIIIMTAFGTTDTAIQAMQLGAYDYILKPFEVMQIKSLIEKALEAGRVMTTEVNYEESGDFKGDRIIGSSSKMQEIYKLIGQIAASDATVLLGGESGTGKELIARAIYHYSQRKQKPFMVINSAAIPENLLESELFGYEKGAFTDARERRIGKLEQCNGGTIFLDEIGDMPLTIQTKLLRVLENQSFERLGGNQNIKVDIRFITATNKNLEKLVKEGKFREDFYYRLNVVNIQIPPLRDRKEDIPLLVKYFICKYNQAFKTKVQNISSDALNLLLSHTWPGNIRELENIIKKSLLLGKGNVILPEDMLLPKDETADNEDYETFLKKALYRRVRQAYESGESSLYQDAVDPFEKILLVEVLKQTRGNQSQAAKLLGISRPTLKDKIEKLGIRKEIQIQEV